MPLPAHLGRGRRSGVVLVSLLFGTFVTGSAELLTVGLLPLISSGLGVAVAAAGALFSAYALGLAIGGPVADGGDDPAGPAAVLVGSMALFAMLVGAPRPCRLRMVRCRTIGGGRGASWERGRTRPGCRRSDARGPIHRHRGTDHRRRYGRTRQRPQPEIQEMSTRLPSLMPVTAAPTSNTVPTASCPRIRPDSTSGESPLRMCRSVPQLVTAATRPMASRLSCISGSATSAHSMTPGPR